MFVYTRSNGRQRLEIHRQEEFWFLDDDIVEEERVDGGEEEVEAPKQAGSLDTSANNGFIPECLSQSL